MKRFDEYLNNRLSKEEIHDIQLQARREHDTLQYLQTQISSQLEEYMHVNKVGFNELARRLDLSASQLSKIQKKQANMTLATFAHVLSIIQKQPVINFVQASN